MVVDLEPKFKQKFILTDLNAFIFRFCESLTGNCGLNLPTNWSATGIITHCEPNGQGHL